jgi:hypothetical protein
MENKTGFLILLTVMLCSTMGNAQNGNDQNSFSNPRVSGAPAYVKDTLSAQRKSVMVIDSISSDSAKALQNAPIKGGVLTLAGLLGFPQNDFSTNTHDAIGYGFDLAVLFNLSSKRSRADWERRGVNIYFGGTCQFMRLDGTRDRYTYQDLNYNYSVTSKVRNNLLGLGLLTRVEFFPGAVKLFVETGVGTRLFNGSHQIEVESTPKASSNISDPQTSKNSNSLQSAWIGDYSYGGGLRISTSGMGIEFKLLSVKGSTADYVDIKSVKFDHSKKSVTYQTKQSQTDLFVFQIGLSGRF